VLKVYGLRQVINFDQRVSPQLATLSLGTFLNQNIILVPLAIKPIGHFGSILQYFLFDIQPTGPITFMQAEPHATLMYSKIMRFPSPKRVLTLADHNWQPTPPCQFYGHSYSAPIPTITTLQQLGLTLTKAFTLHIHYAMPKIHDHSLPTPPPSDPDPPHFGQQVGI
jgi:hypothetical protein